MKRRNRKRTGLYPGGGVRKKVSVFMWRLKKARRTECLPDQEYDTDGLTRKQKIRARIRHMKPLPWYAAAASCLLLFVLSGTFSLSPSMVQGAVEGTAEPDEDLSLCFVGDIMLGRGIAQIGDADGYGSLFSGVSSLWEGSDYVFANLENAILEDDTDGYEEQEKDINVWADYTALDAAMDAGINAFACANNHIYDYGEEAVADLADYFTETGTLFSGIGNDIDEAAGYSLVEAGGQTIAFLSITDVYALEAPAGEDKAGVLTTDGYTDYNMLVYQASREADLTIVYVHWGEENQTSSNEEQENIAHFLADAGADIIIGSHPHVLQDVELYGDSIIFYSLGNFIFDQGSTYACDSVLVQYAQDADGEGAFTLVPVRISDGKPAVTDNTFYRARIFRELSQGLEDGSYYMDDNGYLVIPFTAGQGGA